MISYYTKDKFKEKYNLQGGNVMRPSEVTIGTKCTGSLLLQSDTTKYAKMGQVEHSKFYDKMKELISQDKYKKAKASEKHQDEYMNEYERMAVTLYNLKPEFWALESPLGGIFFNYLVEGYVDLICLKDNVLYVVDLKTGQRPLDKDMLNQLYVYALLFIDSYNMWSQAPKLKYRLILHGRHGSIKRTVSFKNLMRFKNRVIKKLNSGVKFNPGSACLNCYKFNKCSAVASSVSNVLGSFEGKKLDLGKALKMKPIIDKFYKKIEEQVLFDFSNGKKPPEGAKVIAGRRHKEWHEDISSLSLEKKKKLKLVEKIPEVWKDVTVTKALTNKLKVKEGKHWFWRPGKNKVVWEGDKGKELIAGEDLKNKSIKEFSKELAK